MTAPVVGSWLWPPWIVRVEKARRFLPVWSFLGSPQMVDQVDAGDQAEELVAVEDDRDLVAVEHRQQRVERLVGLQRVQVARSSRCGPAR